MKAITQEWLNSAKSDLETIEEIQDNDSLTHVIAFHAQQCVEKAFKAVIEEFELALIKTHDLITLKSIILPVYKEILDDDLLSLLNKLYIDSRYPGELGLLPYGKPTVDDAKRFYENAKEIHGGIRKFLNNL